MFLNDGFIQLEVFEVENNDIHCRVQVGGELRSRKGLNLPRIDLGISAFTDRDRECLKFVLEQGVDAVGQSFVGNAADVLAVREAAQRLGGDPFIIAKIERPEALDRIDAILEVADGIMVARGDLGVEIPIEEIAVVQKNLMERARDHGKPVITATQMLESMVNRRRPTRAEATDVANAILDGTDCVMLSEESAMGKFPVEAVAMLAKIAAATEPHRDDYRLREALRRFEKKDDIDAWDLIALSVHTTLERSSAAVVMAPTYSGVNARNLARFRLPVWIAAVSPLEPTCQGLQFSYGIYPMHRTEYPKEWNKVVQNWLDSQGIGGGLVLLVEGPSPIHPGLNHRMEILDLREVPS